MSAWGRCWSAIGIAVTLLWAGCSGGDDDDNDDNDAYPTYPTGAGGNYGGLPSNNDPTGGNTYSNTRPTGGRSGSTTSNTGGRPAVELTSCPTAQPLNDRACSIPATQLCYYMGGDVRCTCSSSKWDCDTLGLYATGGTGTGTGTGGARPTGGSGGEEPTETGGAPPDSTGGAAGAPIDECPSEQPAGSDECSTPGFECNYPGFDCTCTSAGSWRCFESETPATGGAGQGDGGATGTGGEPEPVDECPGTAPRDNASCTAAGLECEYQDEDPPLVCICRADGGWRCYEE